jgi:hypothetical protein
LSASELTRWEIADESAAGKLPCMNAPEIYAT